MRGVGNEKTIERSISGDGWCSHHLITFDVLRISGETSNHASDAILELSVLGGVDERVDTAAGVHQYNAKVVEPVVVAIYDVADETEKIHDLVG